MCSQITGSKLLGVDLHTHTNVVQDEQKLPITTVEKEGSWYMWTVVFPQFS